MTAFVVYSSLLPNPLLCSFFGNFNWDLNWLWFSVNYFSVSLSVKKLFQIKIFCNATTICFFRLLPWIRGIAITWKSGCGFRIPYIRSLKNRPDRKDEQCTCSSFYHSIRSLSPLQKLLFSNWGIKANSETISQCFFLKNPSHLSKHMHAINKANIKTWEISLWWK